jgi:small-conductance mechanosensitive channel
MQGSPFAAIWSSIREAFWQAPDWVAGVLALASAAALALLLYQLIFVMLRRAVGERHPFLRSVLQRTRALGGFALAAFALTATAAWGPLDPSVGAVLARILLVAFIVLAGWIAHVAVETTSVLYLRRFAIDSTDNLLARKHITQVRILNRAIHTLIVVVTLGAALMTFATVRQYGVSLFASAGVAGIVAGLAARPVLSNLFAGIQIATTQPIRIDDQVIVEGESGRIEEITSTYVVIRIWDLRRLIVPISYFIEKPFQNWTRDATNLTGIVFLYVDYTAPVDRIRSKLFEIVKSSDLWDGLVVKLHVTDAKESSIQLRVLASARNSGDAFELGCQIREKLIDFLQRELPGALPRQRGETVTNKVPAPATGGSLT